MATYNEIQMDNNLQKIWSIIGPQQNRTKGPFHRIRNAYNSSKYCINNNISGDFLEFGVWKGGIIGCMTLLAQQENKNRKCWAFDSFKGMSAPDLTKDLLDGETIAKVCLQPKVQLHNFNLGDFKHTCFNMLRISPNNLNIVEGWADKTIPENVDKIDKIAVLRIDFDWYEPTKQVLEYFYPKVVKGGFIICDDYGVWKGARLAIDEYRKEHNINEPLIQTKMDNGANQPSLIVGTEHYWCKK
jgi:O-methyltransferase